MMTQLTIAMSTMDMKHHLPNMEMATQPQVEDNLLQAILQVVDQAILQAVDQVTLQVMIQFIFPMDQEVTLMVVIMETTIKDLLTVMTMEELTSEAEMEMVMVTPILAILMET